MGKSVVTGSQVTDAGLLYFVPDCASVRKNIDGKNARGKTVRLPTSHHLCRPAFKHISFLI